MKLYYTPGAYSLAPRIIACEAGLQIEYDKVDLKTQTTASGRDYIRINPKGYVPALALHTGDILAEVPVILEYLADQVPAARLLSKLGSLSATGLRNGSTSQEQSSTRASIRSGPLRCHRKRGSWP